MRKLKLIPSLPGSSTSTGSIARAPAGCTVGRTFAWRICWGRRDINCTVVVNYLRDRGLITSGIVRGHLCVERGLGKLMSVAILPETIIMSHIESVDPRLVIVGNSVGSRRKFKPGDWWATHSHIKDERMVGLWLPQTAPSIFGSVEHPRLCLRSRSYCTPHLILERVRSFIVRVGEEGGLLDRQRIEGGVKGGQDLPLLRRRRVSEVSIRPHFVVLVIYCSYFRRIPY